MKLLPVGPSRLKPLPELGMRVLAGIAAAGTVIAGFHLFSLILPRDLPFSLFWVRSLLLASLLIPAWLALEPSSGRAGFRRAGLLLLCTGALLLPFVIIAAGSRLTGPFPDTAILLWAGALLLAALAEEIEFRGFLQDLLSYRGMKIPGIGLSAVLFAFVHMDNPSANLLSTVNIFLFGILLSMLRIRTGGLAAPTILHWLWNSVTGIVLGLNVSGLELPSLFKPAGTLPWGGFGPEESPVLTACLALLCAAFVMGRDRTGPAKPVFRSVSGCAGAAPDGPSGGDGCGRGDSSPAVREMHSWFVYPGLPRA